MKNLFSRSICNAIAIFLLIELAYCISPFSPFGGATHEESQFQCELYMAPSSIPGAGFGIFTTRNIKGEELVLPHSDGPTIVVCGQSYGSGHFMSMDDWNHGDYLWGPHEFTKTYCHGAKESVMSFGSICNYHTYLSNIQPHQLEYDDTVANRYTDPGAGAFSYFNGNAFKTTRDIMAGEELFADYGETWIESREKSTEYAKYILRLADFEDAAEAIAKVFKQYGTDLDDKLLALIKDILHDDATEGRTASLIPTSVAEYMRIIEQSEKMLMPEIAMTLAKGSVHQKSVEWIQENGMCVHNLHPKESTIPGAGRGAFSQTHMLEGSLILPIPLLTVLDRENLEYVTTTEDEVTVGELLLNYCFSHEKGSILLCPATNAILVNHCSSRNPQGGHCSELGGPNAKIQWGSKWDPKTPEWLDFSMEEIQKRVENHARGLSFELIATRDILPGEEVFIDYGENWENAWNAHVDNWQPRDNDGTYFPIRTMIENKQFRTQEELESNPYPLNVQQVCCFWPEEFHDYEEEELIDVSFDGSDYISNVDLEYLSEVERCDIIERSSKSTYFVIIHTSNDEDDESIPVEFHDYPEDCISFRLEPGTSDAHWKDAFRHYIEIEDEMFPDQWKILADDVHDGSVIQETEENTSDGNGECLDSTERAQTGTCN